MAEGELSKSSGPYVFSDKIKFTMITPNISMIVLKHLQYQTFYNFPALLDLILQHFFLKVYTKYPM